MWVRHRVEETFVKKRVAQSTTIENQQQNNPVHVVESDSDKEMEDESEAHISDDSEEEFDDTIDEPLSLSHSASILISCFIMAARKRRRTYTFKSKMPQSPQENNNNQETAIEDNQDTHATPTPLEDSPQELNRNNTTDASVQSSLASSGSGSNMSNDVRKKGRGPALGYQGKEKIKIIFNECMQPIGDSSTALVNLLGGIVKCEARAPLNIVS
ncbi:hypothetical protein Tco_1549058 [Tanacetum coccineum]